MKQVVGLDGRIYPWNLSEYKVYKNDKKKRSKLHKRARRVIKKVFHSYTILEEVLIPGGLLRLDFLVPNIYLAIEVHGQQHYGHIPYFHRTKADFIKSLNRDERKIGWCFDNDVDIIVLRYSDDDDEWERQLRKRERCSE